MAIDTSRDRLERLYFIAGERRLWGRTWVTFVTREPNRVIVRSRKRGQGLVKGLTAVAAVALFGIYPAVGALRSNGGYLLPWQDVSTCDGLGYRYEVARNAVGAPRATDARNDFLTARASCERFAGTLPSSTQSVSCHAAIRTYARALRHVEQRHLGVAPVVDEQPTDFFSATRSFQYRANDALGIDEVQSDERVAAAYLDACSG